MDNKKRILVIEDEPDIQELIRFNLTTCGFEVQCVPSAEAGIQTLGAFKPDLILLDLMLPGMNGVEFCRQAKSNPENSAPIIMVTARGAEEDVVRGLEAGADDYISKPFSPKIMLARVNAVLRRLGEGEISSDDEIRIKDLVIHTGRHEVRVSDRPVDLTNTEFMILKLLATRPGWVFTRSQIVNGIRGENFAVTDRSVDFQIVGIRRKLGESSDFIETVRGVGYRLKDLT